MSSSAVIVPHINILLAAALAVTDLEMMEPVEKLVEGANDDDDNNNNGQTGEDEEIEEEAEEEAPQLEGTGNEYDEEEKKEDDSNTNTGGKTTTCDDTNAVVGPPPTKKQKTNDDQQPNPNPSPPPSLPPSTEEEENAAGDNDNDNPTEEGAIDDDDEEEEEEQGGQPKLGNILREEVFEAEEFQTFVDSNRYDTVTIAIDTEWIKCACGSLKFGVRFGQGGGSTGSSSDDPLCLIWDFFGGTDTDRSHVGDTFFWQAVQEAAPTITSQQWMEFVESHDVLVVEEKDDDDEDEEEDQEDEDEYRPHAAFPDIFKSVLLLAVADKLLEGGLQFTNDGMSLSPTCAWTLLGTKSTDPIKSFGMDLHGHTWTRKQTPTQS